MDNLKKKLINFKDSSTKEKKGNDKRKADEVEIRTVGPWGGSKGRYFDDGNFSGIREIQIGYANWILSIGVVYDKDGNPTEQFIHGTNNWSGIKFAKIKLQYPQEFIIKVSGIYGPAADPEGDPIFDLGTFDTYVKSLTFVSNLQTYGPYGVERGRSFSFTTDGNKIVGLMGRSYWHLHAIGFHYSVPVAPSGSPFRNGWAKVRPICIPSQDTRTVGPWGASAGHRFDDGIYSGIREIKIGYDLGIRSISVVYDKDGNPTEQSMHGNNARPGIKFAEIKLQYPQEFIIKVSGTTADPRTTDFNFLDTSPVVKSLTFVSNLRIYGPYEREAGTSFSFTTDGNKIVGLMGRTTGNHLVAIGFHLSAPVAPSANPFRNGWAKVRSICIPSQGKKRKEEPKVQSQSQSGEPPKKMEPSSKDA